MKELIVAEGFIKCEKTEFGKPKMVIERYSVGGFYLPPQIGIRLLGTQEIHQLILREKVDE